MSWTIENMLILDSLRLKLKLSAESHAPPFFGVRFSLLAVHDLRQGQQGVDRPAVLLFDQGMLT
jgi:hypothetical protein